MKSDAFAQAKDCRAPATLGTDLGDRLGDARAMYVRRQGNKKAICWPFVKPSDGLEPSTPYGENAVGPEARHGGLECGVVGGLGGGLEGDVVAERFELFDDPAGSVFG